MRPIGPEVNNGKVSAFVRVVPSLKNRLAAYARTRGLTLNAAATVLLADALDETDSSG